MSNKFCSELDYTDQGEVEREYPDATEVIEVEGGWMVFDTATDADIWRNQT
jgi:hypothetical protein